MELMTELLEKIEKAPKKNDKQSMINALVDKYKPNFGIFMNMIYIREPEWSVGVPEFKPTTIKEGMSAVSLLKETAKLHYFLDSYTKISNDRKTELLIQLLESLDPVEANLLVELINGTLKIKGYTKKDWEEFVKIKTNLIKNKR